MWEKEKPAFSRFYQKPVKTEAFFLPMSESGLSDKGLILLLCRQKNKCG